MYEEEVFRKFINPGRIHETYCRLHLDDAGIPMITGWVTREPGGTKENYTLTFNGLVWALKSIEADVNIAVNSATRVATDDINNLMS